jgi:hypothetical protein
VNPSWNLRRRTLQRSPSRREESIRQGKIEREDQLERNETRIETEIVIVVDVAADRRRSRRLQPAQKNFVRRLPTRRLLSRSHHQVSQRGSATGH